MRGFLFGLVIGASVAGGITTYAQTSTEVLLWQKQLLSVMSSMEEELRRIRLDQQSIANGSCANPLLCKQP